MLIIRYVEKNIFTISLFLIVLLAVVFNFTREIKPLIETVAGNSIIHDLFLHFTTILPLVWLLTSKNWRNAPFSRKILLIGVFVFPISLTFDMRFNINASVAFYICAVFYFILNRKIDKPDILFYLFFAYFLLHAISLLWTTDSDLGEKMLGRYIPFITVPIACLFFKLSRQESNRLLLVVFRATTIFVFISFLCWIYQSRMMDMALTDWFVKDKMEIEGKSAWMYIFSWSNYNHPTFLATIYSAALGFGFYLTSLNKDDSNRIYFLELAIYVIGVFLLALITQSRTSLIQLMIICFFCTIWVLRKKPKIKLAFVLCSIVLCIAFGLLLQERIHNFMNDPIREQLYKVAFSSISEHPISGTGIGGMAEVLASSGMGKYIAYDYEKVYALGNPHNQFVGDWMQTGLFGLIMIVIITIYLFYSAVRKRNYPLFIFMTSIFVLLMIEMPLSLNKGIFIFVPLVCFLYQRNELKKENAQS